MINHVSIEDNNTAPDTPAQDYTGTGECWVLASYSAGDTHTFVILSEEEYIVSRYLSDEGLLDNSTSNFIQCK